MKSLVEEEEKIKKKLSNLLDRREAILRNELI